MNFGQICEKIGNRTLRPDKLDEIQDAVNDAIEWATIGGPWADDLVEGSVAIDSTVYSQSIVVSTTFTRYRRMKYLKPYGYNKNITMRDPDKIFDENQRESLDVWYRAGDNIVFKLSALTSSMLFGYYQYPERMTEDSDTHWMFDKLYTAIFNEAAADIWESIGNSEEATRYRGKALNMLVIHRRDHGDS